VVPRLTQAGQSPRSQGTLIVWGTRDGYMPEQSARAYRRDLPDAELHLLDAGHWPLETHIDEITALIRNFLNRVHASTE
jgi:pimeloyl-ACP methyl ester carboxylesterase